MQWKGVLPKHMLQIQSNGHLQQLIACDLLSFSKSDFNHDPENIKSSRASA
jgi:hypothetical protein